MVSFKNVSSVGGDGIIPLNFQEDVPKYDPSSFYNWEQDNIPIWVLEQRGDSLYRQMGFPGGNPEGVTFTLSSTGNMDESKGIYDNIQDIVERIPKRLKFPVLVEICTYGNLGKLDLANITCEGEGKLEIKNKTFFSDVNASAGLAQGVTDVSASPADSILGNRQYVKQVYSVNASATAFNASSTRLARKYGNYNSWYDNGRLFAMQGPDTDRQANNITAYIPSSTYAPAADTLSWLNSTNGLFKIPHPYDWKNDYGAGANPQAAPATPATPASGWGDATPYWGSSVNNYMVEQRAEVYTQGQCSFVGYGAWFSSVSLKDCQGTVILRDILVDGGGQQNDYDGTFGQFHSGTNGFDIENTEVILDNTASIRNSTAGYRVTNSRIKITGHCLAWRNYTKTGKTSADRTQNGTGFLSYNSDLEWDSTAYLDSRKYINYFCKSKRGLDLRNSTMRGGITWTTQASALPNAGSQLQGMTRTINGTDLVNCSGGGGDILTTLINISDCNEHGLYAEGSDIEFNGRFNSFLNVGDGMRMRRSTVSIPQFTSNNNSGWGINLEGSQCTYGGGSENFTNRVDNYNAVIGDTATSRVNTNGTIITAATFGGNGGAFTESAATKLLPIRNRAQFHVDTNNQNVLVDKSSSLVPTEINNIPKYLGRWGGCWWSNTRPGDGGIGTSTKYLPMSHLGATPYRRNNQPGMVVTNNSDAEFVNCTYAVSSGDSGKGKVAIASNGSNLVFRGTSATCTTFNFYPLETRAEQFRSWLTAGVVGTGNSNIEFTGPTKSARFGVPFLAENSSHMKFKPPTFVGTDNILDMSGYTLFTPGSLHGQKNHTSLEVQASRACMVANKNSSIRLYGLGGKVVGNIAGTDARNSVDVLATDYADQFLGNQNSQWDRCTSGGYAKFYPHGFTSGVIGYGGGTYQARLALDEANSNFYGFDSSVRYLTPTSFSQDGAMTGGMVCRAVQDSSVDINLVNFYYNGIPGDVSGAYYNLIGTGCGKGTDVLADTGSGSTGNTDTIEETTIPPGGGAGAVGVGGDPPTGGTGDGDGGDGFDNSLVTNSVNNTTSTGKTSDQEGQGALYTAAGAGGEGGGSNLIVNNQQPGSMTVIGDERAPAPYSGGTNQSDQEKRYYAYMRDNTGSQWNFGNGNTAMISQPDPTCMGSQIQIWNIADTSRIHASNILANGMDPLTWSLSAGAPGGGSNCHGPTGKWFNGVSLDYYGIGGRRTSYGGCGNVYANTGVFRLMLSTRGDLKSFYDVSTLSGTSTGAQGWKDGALSGGSPVDQINGAGYTHWTQNVRVLGAADQTRRLTGTDCDFPNGIYQLSSCLRVNGWGMPANDPSGGVATMQPRLGGFSAFNAVTGVVGQPSGAWIYTTAEPVTPLAPLGMDYYGFMRNWFDESAMGMWQNVKHMAEDKVNGVSIYRSSMSWQGGGEGRDKDPTYATYGVGVRSLNLFDLERLM